MVSLTNPAIAIIDGEEFDGHDRLCVDNYVDITHVTPMHNCRQVVVVGPTFS